MTAFWLHPTRHCCGLALKFCSQSDCGCRVQHLPPATSASGRWHKWPVTISAITSPIRYTMYAASLQAALIRQKRLKSVKPGSPKAIFYLIAAMPHSRVLSLHHGNRAQSARGWFLIKWGLWQILNRPTECFQFIPSISLWPETDMPVLLGPKTRVWSRLWGAIFLQEGCKLG